MQHIGRKIVSLGKLSCILTYAVPDQKGGGSESIPPPPLKSPKYRVISNTGQDPLKNHKAAQPAFNAGPSAARQRNAI